MTIFCFESTDRSAPLLTGESGTLVNLLDKCLVTGYASVSVTGMSRAGSTVTVTTSAAHNFNTRKTVQIAGANEAAYNGKWRVTAVPTSTTFTFDIGTATPATPASGTITAQIAPVGWSKPFTDTNAASFKMPVGSNGHYLDVGDNAVDAGRSALVRGYIAMTAAGVGSDAFPTTTQQANYYWRKSNASDSMARPWYLLADEHCFYFMPAWHASYSTAVEAVFFGQGLAFNDADVWLTMLIGAGTAASGAGYAHGGASMALDKRSSSSSSGSAIFAAKSYAGIDGAVRVGMDALFNTFSSSSAQASQSVPTRIIGDNLIVQCFLTENLSPVEIRGLLPGWWPTLYNQPDFSQGAVRNDIAGYAGREFIGIKTGSNISSASRQLVFVDLTGPWR